MPHTRDGLRTTLRTETLDSGAAFTTGIDADQDRVLLGFQYYVSTQFLQSSGGTNGERTVQLWSYIGSEDPDPNAGNYADDEDWVNVWHARVVSDADGSGFEYEYQGNRDEWYGQHSGIYWPEGVTLTSEWQYIETDTGESVTPNVKQIFYWAIADDLPLWSGR